MAQCKVKNEELRELAEYYNAHGRKAFNMLLSSKYGIKNNSFIFKRMCRKSSLVYDAETDKFTMSEAKDTEKVFMSMDELCSPVVPQHVIPKEQAGYDDRPAAMDKLIHQLIGDRLLELSRYVKMDPLSKRIIVDRTSLTADGYQLLMH